MSVDNRSRAQWREAFEQCQAHARKMRRELRQSKADAWDEGFAAGVHSESGGGGLSDPENPYLAGSPDDDCGIGGHRPAVNAGCHYAPADASSSPGPSAPEAPLSAPGDRP